MFKKIFSFNTPANTSVSAPQGKLNRQVSINVSNQGKHPLCWNYTAIRVFTRVIDNVLGLDLDEKKTKFFMFSIDNKSCPPLYDDLNNIDIAVTKRKCKGNDYIKILLYYFLFSLGNAKFSCKINDKGTIDIVEEGKGFYDVFKFFHDEILDNPSFRNNKNVQNLKRYGLISKETQQEFENILYPALDRFYVRNAGYKDLKYLIRGSYLNGYKYKSGLDIIKETLDHGLYLYIGVVLGSGNYKQEFKRYKRRNGVLPPRPVAKYINYNKENKKRHAMTIVGYSVKKEDPNVILLTIKNSWGVNWGVNGTIKIFASELRPLSAVILSILPSDTNVLTQRSEPLPFEDNERTNIIDEFTDEQRVIEKKYLSFFARFGNINKKKFQSLYKELSGGEDVNIKKTHAIFQEVNNSVSPDDWKTDFNIDVENLATRMAGLYPKHREDPTIDYILDRIKEEAKKYFYSEDLNETADELLDNLVNAVEQHDVVTSKSVLDSDFEVGGKKRYTSKQRNRKKSYKKNKTRIALKNRYSTNHCNILRKI
jgi:hypothetical protein